jgi:SH3-like domain-containing protein
MRFFVTAGLLAMAHSVLLASTAIVLRPVANMHSAPNEDSDVVSQAIYGSNIEIVEEKNNWAKIRTPDDYTGWMYKAFLLRSSRKYAVGHAVEAASLFLNIYSEPSVTKHKPLITVPFETRLEPIGESDSTSDRWMQVRLPDDHAAWLQRGDVVADPQPMSIPRMIELSKKFIGLPYLWGGTSSFGFDCSGFTQMLCRRRGILMPRDADVQAAWSGVREVDPKAMKPGDLLFFGPSEKKITHTGLYIGNGEFINATTHEKPIVQIDKLADPHWTKLLVGVRRLKESK